MGELLPGETLVPWDRYLHTHGQRAVRRWEVVVGDPHLDHHVTLKESPNSPPAERWLITSTHREDRDIWGWPTAEAAMDRVRHLWRLRHGGWTWTEVPPTPYDKELGRMPVQGTGAGA